VEVKGPAGEAIGLVSPGQAVLVAGLAPWCQGPLAGAIVGRAKSVAVVAGKAHPNEWKAFGKKAPVAHLSEADWAEKVGDHRFDTILASEPLTHLPDPLAFLRQARALLKPDGALVALVPNVAFGETRLQLLKGEFPGAVDGSASLHHYTRRRLRELFALAGYRLAEVRLHQQPIFTSSELTPELFPETLLQLVGNEDDAIASHFAIRAVPAPMEAILSELFEEQDRLRKLARNELAKSARTHDGLSRLLKEGDAQRHQLRAELEAAQKAAVGMAEFHGVAEANIRKLTEEADSAIQELAAIKRSWFYRLGQLFQRRPAPAFPPISTEPGAWIYEEIEKNKGKAT
jgi:predicted SAM-dependent methyltransferase